MSKQHPIIKVPAPITRRLLPAFTFAVRLAIGCLFLWSSLPKIRQPYDFLSAIYSYELVGPKLGMLTAMVLPWLELFVGLSLLGGIFVSGALLATIAMAAMFTFALASALYRSLEISCGCFSPSDPAIISYSTLVRAALILIFSIAAYICLLIFRPAQYVHKHTP